MAETNVEQIHQAVNKFGSKVVLEKIKELYQKDDTFLEFCNLFIEVFKPEFKNFNFETISLHNVKIKKIRITNSVKQSYDKQSFIFMCLKNNFKHNLLGIGYNRFDFHGARKFYENLSPRIKTDIEYSEKINNLQELWQSKIN
jgi:hypothetical protein